MRVKVKLPRVADTADTVVLVEWAMQPGEAVGRGDPLLRVETDKALVEVPSPVAGQLIEHLIAIDDEIHTGDAVAIVEVEG